jgi:sulfonate transport system permease protein
MTALDTGIPGPNPGPDPGPNTNGRGDPASPSSLSPSPTSPPEPVPAATPSTAIAPEKVEAATLGRRGGAARPRLLTRIAVPRPLRRLVGPVVLIGVWQVLSAAGVLSERTLAPPTAVASAGWDLARTGELSEHLLVSLHRVAVGLAYGVTAGVVLAVLAGLFRTGDDVVDPVMQVLRGVPVLGLMPLIILWFGIGETTKILLVAIGTAFPVYVNTYAGIRGVDAKLVEAATTCGVGRAGLVRRVILPGALPNFLVGLRFALTGAWLIMIVAEQINARSGIGYLMNEARMWYQTDVIVFGLVVYGALGLGTDGLVRLVERTALSWRHGFTGT